MKRRLARYLDITSILETDSFVDKGISFSILIDESRGESSIDSALIIKSASCFIVNSNDMNLTDEHLDKLSELDVDIFAHKYYYPGPYPALFDMADEKKEIIKQQQIQRAENNYIRRVNKVRARVKIPIAGSCKWSAKDYVFKKFRGIYDPIELKKVVDDIFIPNEEGTSSLQKIDNNWTRLNERVASYKVNSQYENLFCYEKVFSTNIEVNKNIAIELYIQLAIRNASAHSQVFQWGFLLIFSAEVQTCIDFTDSDHKITKTVAYDNIKL